MKQSRPSRKSRRQAMGGGVIGFTKMFGLHAHIIEDTSPMPNSSRFSFGATNLREKDLVASWPVTRVYHNLYTQDLASSFAQSPMRDAYRIDILTWKLDHVQSCSPGARQYLAIPLIPDSRKLYQCVTCRFFFGATNLREDALEASWPATLAYSAGLGAL
ncbi:hypothetical protein B9479_008172 [Cryptococcus floricola]|uniref:Uncharacterized protein n=1 Tax=Cryptococcus floricola TaxID=2591691 RepID=A0A5D3AI53_9TREE|nr:hypothetical protein B9479_008172 [Cryptococcus floricola]